jgi:hypothetical protein
MMDRHLMHHNVWKGDNPQLGLLSGVVLLALWISMMLSISQQLAHRSFGLSSITIWESIGHGD